MFVLDREVHDALDARWGFVRPWCSPVRRLLEIARNAHTRISVDERLSSPSASP